MHKTVIIQFAGDLALVTSPQGILEDDDAKAWRWDGRWVRLRGFNEFNAGEQARADIAEGSVLAGFPYLLRPDNPIVNDEMFLFDCRYGS